MNAKPWNTPAVCPTPHSEIHSSQIEFWVKKTCLTWFHQDNLSEMVLILWGEGECVFSQWHTTYLCAPISRETGLLWVSMQTERKSSKWSIMASGHSSSCGRSQKKNLSLFKARPYVQSLINFSKFHVVIWCYLLALSPFDQENCSRVCSDFGCWQNIALEIKSKNLLFFFFYFPTQSTSQSCSGSFCEGG